MSYTEILENAKKNIVPYCKACPECNGRACKNQIPGPGAKGIGDTAIRNYEKWKEIRLNMDTLVEASNIDTKSTILGKEFAYPFFAGPVGAINLHYGDSYNDLTYNEVLVKACADIKRGLEKKEPYDANLINCFRKTAISILIAVYNFLALKNHQIPLSIFRWRASFYFCKYFRIVVRIVKAYLVCNFYDRILRTNKIV